MFGSPRLRGFSYRKKCSFPINGISESTRPKMQLRFDRSLALGHCVRRTLLEGKPFEGNFVFV